MTDSEIAQLRMMAGQVGLGPNDILFPSGSRSSTAYSVTFDKILIGPDVLQSASEIGQTSVLARMSPRAVIAHEAGHLITVRAGKSLEAGSLLDEVQASLVGRQLRGISNTERMQLLRDAVERAQNQGKSLRDLIPQLPYFQE